MTEGTQSVGGGTALAEVRSETLEQLAGRAVTVGGESVRVGKLSIDQWLGLARATGKAVMRMGPSDRAALSQAAGTDDGNVAGVLALFEKSTLLELYAVALNREGKPALDHLGSTFDIGEFFEVVDAVDEFNDLRKVIATFQRVAARWRPSSKTSSQP